MWRWSALALLLLACDGGSDSPAICAGGDYECYLDHIVVSENGTPITLTKVPKLPGPRGDAVWAVGRNGVILRWDGQWRALPAPTPPIDFFSVHGTAENNVWIGGAHGTVFHWDGTSLQLVPGLPTDSSVTSVYATNPDTVEAVTEDGHYCTSDGASWTCADDALPILRSVWRTNTTNTWVAGGDVSGTGFLRNMADGSGPIVNATPAFALWTHDDEVWIAGNTVQRLIGGTLTDETPPSSSYEFHAITGVASGGVTSDVFVADANFTMYHWSNGTWQRYSDEQLMRPLGMWAHSANDVWAVGEAGSTAHWDGTGWSTEFHYSTKTLHSVWSSGPSAPKIVDGGAPVFSTPLGLPLTITPQSFSPLSPEHRITLPWHDPQGCRPAFCFSVCGPTGPCVAAARCTPLMPSEGDSAYTDLDVKYTAVPSGASETFDVWVTLVSMPGCTQPVRDGMIDSNALVGGGDRIRHTVEPSSSAAITCGFVGGHCDATEPCCNGVNRIEGPAADRCNCELDVGQPCFSRFSPVQFAGRCCNTHGGLSAEGTVGACGSGTCPGGTDAECEIGHICRSFSGTYACMEACIGAGDPSSAGACCTGLFAHNAADSCHYTLGHLCNSTAECEGPPPLETPTSTFCVPQGDGTARCEDTAVPF